MRLRVVALMALAIAAATDAGASGVEGETSCPIVASTDFAIYAWAKNRALLQGKAAS